MTQTKTQSILPPISKQNYPLMNAKSAPTTPRSTQRYSSKSSPRGDPNLSTQRSNTKKKTTPRPMPSRRLPPASRTTLALNPDFNEYTDPTELTLISRELKQQIVKARRELIPYKEEVRRLEFFYNPHMHDETIENITEKKSGLQKEKSEIDDEMNLNRRACQGSIFSANELQNETLKQDYHEKMIILERIESKLDKKKEKLEQILNSQTAEDIVESHSKIKELTSRLKELKEEGNKLRIQNLKQLSTVGSTKSNESQKLQPYEKKLADEQHDEEKKKGELRTMKNQHQKKVQELKSSIREQKDTLKRIEQRDNWRKTLNIKQSEMEVEVEEEEEENYYDNIDEYEINNPSIEEEEEKENICNEEEEEIHENEVSPPKSQSARSPRRNKLNGIINCAKTLADKNENGDDVKNEEEEENDKVNNNNEEEEEEAEINEEEENNDDKDSENKRNPATTAPVSSPKNNNEDGENNSPLTDLLSQNLETLHNDEQKGLTQPPPKTKQDNNEKDNTNDGK